MENINALLYGTKSTEGATPVVSIDDVDCAIAYCGLKELDAEVNLQDNWLSLRSQDFELYSVCIGGVQNCRIALFKMGLRDFDIPCYPKELVPFMGRSIEITTIGKVIHMGAKLKKQGAKFVKPILPKKFNAFLTSDEDAYSSLYNVEYDEKVYVSDVVKFISEWRVYVKQDEIVRICNYSGKTTVFPNVNVIRTMIESWEGPCCYALDIGIVEDQTKLVEVNDFYSIGNYGLFPTEYIEMLILRWNELRGNMLIT
jgi:hypothetical protein